jgi:6-pyruvoyltetrahydropterin/6-carboxytetrahydropterin synthase
LKKIVKETVVDVFDHALVLSDQMPADLIEELKANFEKIILLPYQPTSELMIVDMAERIQNKLPEHVTLKYLLLRETVTSYAEWFAEDN